MHLVQMEWFLERMDSVLLVTAKGSPDFGTRRFLTTIASLRPDISMFYIGDADPYGAEIYFTFLFGSLTSCVIERKQMCQTLFQLQWIGPFFTDESSQEALKGGRDLMVTTDKDKTKAYSLLNKSYLADSYLSRVNSE